MLRALFVCVIVLAGASLFAATAHAHAHRHASPPAQEPVVAQSAPAAALVLPCRLRAAAARAFDHPYHSHTPGHAHHDDPGHDPSDHSHPPGEDFVFHVMAHAGLDFTAFAELSPPPSRLQSGRPAAPANELGAGITILPPIPPPLG